MSDKVKTITNDAWLVLQLSSLDGGAGETPWWLHFLMKSKQSHQPPQYSSIPVYEKRAVINTEIWISHRNEVPLIFWYPNINVWSFDNGRGSLSLLSLKFKSSPSQEWLKLLSFDSCFIASVKWVSCVNAVPHTVVRYHKKHCQISHPIWQSQSDAKCPINIVIKVPFKG